MELTTEQQATITELQAELKELNLKADVEWAKYLHTNDEACFTEVMALESQIEMKGLIAYIPKAGERKISKIRGLVTKLKRSGGQDCEDCDLGEDEVRLGALESVNEWRLGHGLPELDRLPKGMPGDPHNCTLAMAFTVSMKELGYHDPYVNVSGAADITLSGSKEGETFGAFFEENPNLSEDAQSLIEGFDRNAWLDLLDDTALSHYAESLASSPEDHGYDDDEGDDETNEWGLVRRLQEISDEMARREQSASLEVHLHQQGVWVPEVAFGAGAEPIAVQIEKTNAILPESA